MSFYTTNIPYLSNALLNQVNDATIAGGQNGQYNGLLGCQIWLDQATAANHSYTTTGTLYQGCYQYVKFTSAATVGQLVVWETNANNGLSDYEVTATLAATNINQKAGIALCTITSGNYGWIQTTGLATVAVQATPTNNTIGNLARLTNATTNTVDAIADASANETALNQKLSVGFFYEAPGASGSASQKKILLSSGSFFLNAKLF